MLYVPGLQIILNVLQVPKQFISTSLLLEYRSFVDAPLPVRSKFFVHFKKKKKMFETQNAEYNNTHSSGD